MTRDDLRCGVHQAELESLKERVDDLEDNDDDTRTRVTKLETRRESSLDTFTKFVWPVAILIGSKLIEIALRAKGFM